MLPLSSPKPTKKSRLPPYARLPRERLPKNLIAFEAYPSLILHGNTMNHNDHVHLLRKGISSLGGTWADLGSGSGAFTLALADLLGPEGQIYSVDKDRQALNRQEREMRSHFPSTSVTYQVADFTR